MKFVNCLKLLTVNSTCKDKRNLGNLHIVIYIVSILPSSGLRGTRKTCKMTIKLSIKNSRVLFSTLNEKQYAIIINEFNIYTTNTRKNTDILTQIHTHMHE